MNADPVRCEVAIVGCGPVGLFTAFELGLQELSTVLVDALPQPGGQCAELYPDKSIYDVPGLPVVTAAQLTHNLLAQLRPMLPPMFLGHAIETLQPTAQGGWLLRSNLGLHLEAQAVVIAAGAGCFQPRLPTVEGVTRHWARQLRREVQPQALRGQHVVILGNDDAALQAVQQAVQAPAQSVTLVFRREVFEADAAAVQALQAQRQEGSVRFVAAQLDALVEDTTADQDAAPLLRAVRLRLTNPAPTQAPELELPADVVLVHLGLSPKLGFLASWGLALTRKQLAVDPASMMTNTPGVYAVGDVVDYPGKLKLLLCGFHEAALASFAIASRLRPQHPPRLEYTTTSTRLHRLLQLDATALSSATLDDTAARGTSSSSI